MHGLVASNANKYGRKDENEQFDAEKKIDRSLK